MRKARPSDAVAIAGIAAAAFGQRMAIDQVRRVLQSGRNYTCVAELNRKTVGFADAFVTESQFGEARLELDLLAVDPSAQGSGMGTGLARRCIGLADELKVGLLRTLVATDNLAMRALCYRCGLRQSPDIYRLHVATSFACAETPSRHRAHFVPIDTLAYSGLWLEGELSLEAVQSAMYCAEKAGWDSVGAVVAVADCQVSDLLCAQGFGVADEYHWWTLNLRNDRP